MAAEAQKAVRVVDETGGDKDTRPVVTEAHFKEGGVHLKGCGVQNVLQTGGPTNPGLRASILGLTMRLDRGLGGIEIHHRDPSSKHHRTLVPVGHVRCMELAE